MTKLVRCGINFYADVDHQKAVNDRDSLQNTKLMEHYTHLLGQLQYEGAGIWSRFNIMFGINVLYSDWKPFCLTLYARLLNT